MDKTISLVYFQISWIVHSRHHMQLCNQATISRKSSNLSPPQIMELLDQLWEQDYIVYLSGRPPLAWGSTIGNDSSHTWHSGWDPNPGPRCWSAENGSVHNERIFRGQRPTHVPTRDEVNKIFACWNHHPNGSQHGGYLKLIQNCYQFIWTLMTNFAGFPMVSDQFQVPNPNGVAQARHCS